MTNKGTAPLNPLTEVGRFRIRARDTKWQELDPPVPGYGDYAFWSDEEISLFLEVSESESWAIYEAYLQLATDAALSSKSTSDYDLKLDTTKRADQLLKIAEAWRTKALEDDAISGEEAFEIVPTGTRGGGFIPELAPPIWGREYTIGRWR